MPPNDAGEGVSSIAVIGGGIAGLTAAHALAAAHDVTVFERETTPGGKVRSQHVDGFLFEGGPAGFLSNAAPLRALIAEIGLDDALIEAAPAAKKRFIYWRGRLHELPSKPPGMLRMSLLTPLGKLRALRELAIPRRTGPDESVYEFMRRRFGREVAERIAAPALLGISGGDAAATSLAAVFPRVPELEREHGSVIRGMVKSRAAAGVLSSFSGGGMGRLTARLAERLGPRVRTGATVTRIERGADGWHVTSDRGNVVAGAVIVATPAAHAAQLVAGFDAELAAQLARIPIAAMRAIGVAFRTSDLPAPLDGFGFLAARGCGVRILGATYTSSIFPDQAPPDTAYLRIFLGGATDPEAAALDADAARAIVLADLGTVLGITAAPIAYHEIVWPQAIPQYTLAHRAIVSAIEARAAAHPQLAFTGNSYRGLGAGDTVADALKTAERMSGGA